MSSVAAAQVREVVEPVVTAAGLDIEDVLVRSAGARRLVQLLVDRDGGVDLDAVAAVARDCSQALDTAELFGGAYDLEVSSPGVDRPLTEPRHWRRNTGRLVQARLRDGKEIAGRITATDADSVTLLVGKAERVLPYADLTRGVVQVEFKRVASGTDDFDDVEADMNDDEEAAR